MYMPVMALHMSAKVLSKVKFIKEFNIGHFLVESQFAVCLSSIKKV